MTKSTTSKIGEITKLLATIIGLVTAIGAFITFLYQNEFIGSKSEQDIATASKDEMLLNDTSLLAPVLVKPDCAPIKYPPDNHLFIVAWKIVEGASMYTVEFDCFGCKEQGRNWHSTAGAPWHLRKGLGLRPSSKGNAIYSSKIHMKHQEENGLSIRWRVWAVDHEGISGQKSEWCQFSFYQ